MREGNVQLGKHAHAAFRSTVDHQANGRVGLYLLNHGSSESERGGDGVTMVVHCWRDMSQTLVLTGLARPTTHDLDIPGQVCTGVTGSSTVSKGLSLKIRRAVAASGWPAVIGDDRQRFIPVMGEKEDPWAEPPLD